MPSKVPDSRRARGYHDIRGIGVGEPMREKLKKGQVSIAPIQFCGEKINTGGNQHEQ